MKRHLFVAIVGIFILTACEGSYTENCQTAKFSWKANGNYFEGYIDSHFSSFLESYTLTSCDGTGNGPQLYVRLHTPLDTGTYSLAHVQQAQSAYTGDAFYYNSINDTEFFTTDSTHTGSIHISTFTPPNTISGTFSFNAIKYQTMEVVNITEGQFSLVD